MHLSCCEIFYCTTGSTLTANRATKSNYLTKIYIVDSAFLMKSDCNLYTLSANSDINISATNIKVNLKF